MAPYVVITMGISEYWKASRGGETTVIKVFKGLELSNVQSEA
jgi:hypothetical protein